MAKNKPSEEVQAMANRFSRFTEDLVGPTKAAVQVCVDVLNERAEELRRSDGR